MRLREDVVDGVQGRSIILANVEFILRDIVVLDDWSHPSAVPITVVRSEMMPQENHE
jgi:hypothetical protein